MGFLLLGPKDIGTRGLQTEDQRSVPWFYLDTRRYELSTYLAIKVLMGKIMSQLNVEIIWHILLKIFWSLGRQRFY